MILDWLRRRFRKEKKIDVKTLPSQGYFYPDDFIISIKCADKTHIEEYENGYDSENIGIVLALIKGIVEKNTKIGGGYGFEHIKSIDIVYLFLEIVKFTKNLPIIINYIDDKTGKDVNIKFNEENFNYFIPTEEMFDGWNKEKKCFDINGYSLSLPSIGVENSLTHYLIEKSHDIGAEKYNNYSYNFTFLVGDKTRLSFEEIDNLIQIFNFDLEKEESKKVSEAIEMIMPMQKYSLRKDDRIIDIGSRINLKTIWR